LRLQGQVLGVALGVRPVLVGDRGRLVVPGLPLGVEGPGHLPQADAQPRHQHRRDEAASRQDGAPPLPLLGLAHQHLSPPRVCTSSPAASLRRAPPPARCPASPSPPARPSAGRPSARPYRQRSASATSSPSAPLPASRACTSARSARAARSITSALLAPPNA